MAKKDYPRYDHDDTLIDATRADGRSRVRVYRLNETVVVLGRGSVSDVELDLDACRELNLPIYRRWGGGCSVVIDPGNIIVSVAMAKPGIGDFKQPFVDLTEWLIAGLAAVGVPDVRFDGVSDLVVDDRKISGSCVYRSLGLIFYTATILVEPDVEVVSRCLHHPPREPDYRRGRSHADFMHRISLADTDTVASLTDRLRRTLTAPSLPPV